MTDRIEPEGTTRRSPLRISLWLGFCGFLVIALFFLWQEHRAHLFGALPWLLLLLCPALHFFMHRGEGHQHFDDAEHATPPVRRGGGRP